MKAVSADTLRARRRLLTASTFGRTKTVTPQVLKRRYATGEITREQYEQMRKDLER